MKKFSLAKYFRVYLHQTSITEVQANDFKPSVNRSINLNPSYSLPAPGRMFYDYPGIIQAMENAKKGALVYIQQLIEKARDGAEELVQYRNDHYEDLNFVLVESNIRRLETELKRK